MTQLGKEHYGSESSKQSASSTGRMHHREDVLGIDIVEYVQRKAATKVQDRGPWRRGLRLGVQSR